MTDILANDEMLLLNNLMQNNGLVSRDEFLEWAQKQPELGPYQLLRDIFKLIDTDGSGSLSSAEFSTLIRVSIDLVSSLLSSWRLAFQLCSLNYGEKGFLIETIPQHLRCPFVWLCGSSLLLLSIHRPS